MIKKDILNRSTFVDMIMNFVKVLSDSRKGYCFAIDGKWGSGKTFVLDMLEEQLRIYQSEETADNQFFVFHYNCWKYDYYEEPSIAIVSAMMNAIDDENRFLGKQADGKLKASYELVKKEIKEMAGKFVEKHIGVNVVELWNDINDVAQKESDERNKYDRLFGFRQVLDAARHSLRVIAKQKTIILVVDELDRCIPTYAIKVLERLHHLFEDIENIIVIIAVDSEQLTSSIKKIYGEETKSKDYLKKIIGMTFELDAGKIQQGIFEKYDSFFSKFNEPAEGEVEKIEEIFSNIWNNVDIRTQEKLMEKAEAIHSLIASEKVHISVAIFEIMIVRFQNTYNGKNLYWIPKINNAQYVDLDKAISKKKMEYLKILQEQACSGTVINGGRRNGYKQLRDNLVGNLFWFLTKTYCGDSAFYSEAGDKYDTEIRIAEQFRKLADIIE